MTGFLEAIDQPHLQLLLRLVVGGLLLLAGATKLVDRVGFREAVAEYEVLPKQLERPAAMAIPLLETALGVLLLVGLGTAFAAAVAVPLFLSFGVAIGVNLMRGRNFDCHCFGAVQSDRIGAAAFLRSMALVLAALVVALGASGFGALETALFGSQASLPPAAEVLPIVLIAFVFIDVLILLPETLSFRAAMIRVRAARITGVAHAGHRDGSGA